FLQSGNSAIGFPHLRRHPSENLDRGGTKRGIFLDRDGGHSSLRQRQCGGFVAQAHVGKREISNEEIIVRLFFEKRFQFAASLPPAFPSCDRVARNFLRPA